MPISDLTEWPDADRRDAALMRCLSDVHSNGERNTLTERERDALEAMSHGLGIDGTADLLFVTEEAVKSRLLSARRALRAKNTTHACCEALRQGLIQ